MHGRTTLTAAIASILLLPLTARSDIWIPPWGDSIYDSTFITIEIQDTVTVVEVEVRSAVVKLINDDYILHFERVSTLGRPEPNPEVHVSDRLVQAGWQDGQFLFEFLSQIQVEDTLEFSVRSRYRYSAIQQGSALRQLIYAHRYSRVSDDPIWGGWGEDHEVPMQVFGHLIHYSRIVSNTEVQAGTGSWSEEREEFGQWTSGDTIEFSEDEGDWWGRDMMSAVRIDLRQGGVDDVITDRYTYEITPETRLAVPNLILSEEVLIQHSAWWDTTVHIAGYSMLADIRLEPGLALNLAPMWLWFPNDQTEHVEADLVGLMLSGAWGNDWEHWAEDSIEVRLGQIEEQRGFYLKVPWLEVQQQTPNGYWWWTDPRLRVTVSSRWQADSCRFILVTAPIEQSLIRFTIPREFEFVDWSSPFENVERGVRGPGNYLAFTGLCREPGIARVVWQLAQKAPVEPPAPKVFAIESIAPNPFNSRTELTYTLPRAGDVRLELRDAQGRVIFSESYYGDAGSNTFDLDGSQLPAGIYFVELSAAERVARAKVVCVK